MGSQRISKQELADNQRYNERHGNGFPEKEQILEVNGLIQIGDEFFDINDADTILPRKTMTDAYALPKEASYEITEYFKRYPNRKGKL